MSGDDLVKFMRSDENFKELCGMNATCRVWRKRKDESNT